MPKGRNETAIIVSLVGLGRVTELSGKQWVKKSIQWWTHQICQQEDLFIYSTRQRQGFGAHVSNQGGKGPHPESHAQGKF